jgi:hypothetical protein
LDLSHRDAIRLAQFEDRFVSLRHERMRQSSCTDGGNSSSRQFFCPKQMVEQGGVG